MDGRGGANSRIPHSDSGWLPFDPRRWFGIEDEEMVEQSCCNRKPHIHHQHTCAHMSNEDGLPKPSTCLRNALNLFMKNKLYRPVQITVLSSK